MAKAIYDKNLNVEIPTIVIKRRDFKNIGAIKVSDMIYKNNFNSPNELSFTVYKSVNDESIWDRINDYNIIWLPEYDEYFDMQVNIKEENNITKDVTCTSLCESELSQINLYQIEINTDDDMSRGDYDTDYPTIFYRDLSEYEKGSLEYKKMYNASLLHRILDKATNYTIGHIDDSLKKLTIWYQFSISNTNIYDELMGEISEQYKCLFTFDAKNRTVNAYDLCNTCVDCGYRGEFNDYCPECGSMKFGGAYGKDTCIYISKDNLSTSATISSNKDSLKNCFYIEGGDDLISDSIVEVNPNGTRYIYYFSPEAKKEIPEDLVKNIDEYSEHYDYSYNSKKYIIQNTEAYNDIIDYINYLFPNSKYSHINNFTYGYKNIAKAIYETVDVELFLQSSMFPTIETENETLDDELSKLTVENLSPISVSNVKTVVLSSVDRAVENYCKVYINTALYKISIENSSLSDISNNQRTWTGSIKLTEIANKENYGEVTLSLKVNSDLENFLRQKLEKELAKSDNYSKQIIDIDITETDFKEKLRFYNVDYLLSIHNSFEDCLTIIEDTSSTNKEIYDKFYDLYLKRIKYIDNEISFKNTQLEIIRLIYDTLNDIRLKETELLNLRTFLGEDLWKVFCSYRREDYYKNDNYISNNLTSSGIITKTEELLEAAKKELFKAGNMQFEVSADMNNLLTLPEFSTFANDFDTGNWIHLMIDEKVYSLRLLSYQINFDDLAKVSVSFSTLTKTSNGASDLESVIKSATSISSSYSSFKQQMINNTTSSNYVNDWVENGLDATNTKLVNDNLTQEIVIDSNGILCKAYDDIEDGYDEHQIRINRNAIYLTRDNWEHIYSALGKYYYIDPDTKEEKIAYGVNAETIVGKFILGEYLGIQNERNTLSFDENGLVITNNVNTISISPTDSDLFRISVKTGEEDKKVFYTDENGNLCLEGSLQSKDAYFIDGIYGAFTPLKPGMETKKEKLINFISNEGLRYDVIIDITDSGEVFEIVKQEFGIFNANIEFPTNICFSGMYCNFNGYAFFDKQVNFNSYADFSKGLYSEKIVTPSLFANGICSINNNNIIELKNSTSKVLLIDNSLRPEDSCDGKITLGDSNIRWGQIYSTNQTISISDKNFKNTIEPISDVYEKIYLDTPTYTFFYNNGDRKHFGTISQEIEELLNKHNISPLDFAPFCKDIKTKKEYNEDGNYHYVPELDEDGNVKYIYSMRYGEYTMLTVHMVQKLYKENDLLKQKVETLENKITSLEQRLEKLEQMSS